MQSEKEVGIKGIFSEWEKNFGYMQQNGNDLILTIIILYIIGTGPVKGFAITLSIGIVTSMFTAIMCTRAIVNLVYGNKNIKVLPI